MATAKAAGMDKRIIGVVVVLVVLIGGVIYLMFGSGGEDAKVKKGNSKITTNVQVQQQENKSPLYVEELKKYNEDNNQLAQAQNRSNIKLLNPDKEQVKKAKVVENQQKTPAKNVKEQIQAQQMAEYKKGVDALSMKKLQFFQMMQKQEARAVLPVTSLDAGYSLDDFVSNGVLQQVADYGSNINSDIKMLLVAGGSSFSATLDQGLDTDLNHEVFATIQSGNLKGAQVKGNVSLKGDYIYVRFNSLYFNNNTYNITAVGMDPDTNMAVLSGDVDNRYLERFGYPFLVSLIQGAGQVMSRTASNTYVSAGGAMTQTTQEASDRAIIGGALQQGMNAVAQGVNQNARTNKVVRRPADAIIVRFLSEVTNKNLKDVVNSNQNNGYANQPNNYVTPPNYPSMTVSNNNYAPMPVNNNSNNINNNTLNNN